ncbi:exodeoxyribonuclease III [Draconibacterium sp. IB214405]|uniref:exodeoxyribonuclease III n=1 Tax=Draconibacterium sp. IB214405 TaxID=3097352 RepID=UPI002A1853A1|nr:exodeoxyribonuclease III [Draconibacterium sp. IB214405]MDX8339545.1 exodeoxyribonuclease III [Draconibacterium sp. IB214405]
MKLISWNVNGIRAVAKKNFFEDFKQMDADILCLQETKAQDDQVAETLESINGYHIYSNSAEKKGYSGTAILSKTEPVSVSRDMGIDVHDTEGRVLRLEYEKFYLVNVYVPNSGSELKRLDYRQEWDLAFFNYLKELEKTKPVLVCGDFNVAHRPIDLARPKPNYNKSAGFMQEEIDGMDRFTQGGLVDSFRHFYPDATDKYSWWSYRAGARGKNIGWRIDYFLVSESFIPQLQKAYILNEVMGSDHCPVGIEIAG